MEAFKPLIAKAAAGLPLTRGEASLAFSQMLSGEVTPAQMAGFLMALRVRGESVEEITGAVSAMRDRMLKVVAPAGAIDVVGTGGDASGSWNVSTLAGLLVAACGVPVAKHGNRAASSKSGAADVLQALGVKIGQPPEGLRPSSPRRASPSCWRPRITRPCATWHLCARNLARARCSTCSGLFPIRRG